VSPLTLNIITTVSRQRFNGLAAHIGEKLIHRYDPTKLSLFISSRNGTAKKKTVPTLMDLQENRNKKFAMEGYRLYDCLWMILVVASAYYYIWCCVEVGNATLKQICNYNKLENCLNCQACVLIILKFQVQWLHHPSNRYPLSFLYSPILFIHVCIYCSRKNIDSYRLEDEINSLLFCLIILLVKKWCRGT